MSFRVLSLNDEAYWTRCIERIERKDITFLPQYLRVFEVNGDGRAECFIYEAGGDFVIYPYIRRELVKLPFARREFAGYYDIITAHGYAGFLHSLPYDRDPTSLLGGFRRAFEAYAQATHTVSEFIRFHPNLQNQCGAESLLHEVKVQRNNVFIDLTLPTDELFRQCRESYRQGIRKAREKGLTVERVDPWDHVEEFAKLYRSTMKRLGQTGYLNFPPEFFANLAALLKNDIEMFVVRGPKRLSAAAIFLKYGSMFDYFLAGNQLMRRANYATHLLLHDVSVWAKQQGYTSFHLGGGRDSLVFFKSGFSEDSRPYYTGRHIHNRSAYDRLCELRRSTGYPLDDQAAGYFPLYRAGY